MLRVGHSGELLNDNTAFFKVVLAAIFIKININNRKTRPYSQLYSLVTSKYVPLTFPWFPGTAHFILETKSEIWPSNFFLLVVICSHVLVFDLLRIDLRSTNLTFMYLEKSSESLVIHYFQFNFSLFFLDLGTCYCVQGGRNYSFLSIVDFAIKTHQKHIRNT